MTSKVLKFAAPLDGRVVAIESVPDPVFAQKMVGDGFAIDPTSSTLCAPCAGKVAQIHSAKHAITLQTDSGPQIILHIGLDTVQLKGQGFKPRVKVGAKVKAGQPLIDFDSDYIATNAKSLITVVVVNSGHVKLLKQGSVRAGESAVAETSETPVAKSAAEVSANSSRARSQDVRITLPTGLHARPAAQIVAMAKSFPASIEIWKNHASANAKSVIALMGLEVSYNDTVHFTAEGPEAEVAVNALAKFLSDLKEAPAAHAEVKRVTQTVDDDRITGVGVSPGVAIGKIWQIHEEQLKFEENSQIGLAKENAAFGRALQQASESLARLREKVKNETDAARAAIFSAHLELLEDPDLLESTWRLMHQGKTAAFAWNQTIQSHADRVSKLKNELMAQRAGDLRDVGQRVLRALLNVGESEAAPTSDVILIAKNLTPSQTVQLDRKKVLGFCTTEGGATSHVAILARSLGLPAIAGIHASALKLENGREVILDGDRGELRLNVDAAEKANIRAELEKNGENLKAAQAKAFEPARLLSGAVIEVAANIGGVADANEAATNGADGVGLLRSEFLFLERDTAPSEDEQLAIYQQIADRLGAKPLIIRTLDVGGDKPLRYLPLDPEENPFLGVRGLRVGLLHQEVLRTQLRAILRVKSAARVHVMFPMVATLEDLREAKRILEEERFRLGASPIPVGVMIEVPSAALIAGQLAPEVDFFSLGTNDLTQYTLAMDRGHKDLAKKADALHPSVLKLIAMTCEAARQHGKWVGVCGGLASDPAAIAILIGLGVKELSVSVPAIATIKAKIREYQQSETEALARTALSCASAREVRELTSTRANARAFLKSELNVSTNELNTGDYL